MSEKEKLIKEGVPVLDGRFWLRVTPDRLEAYLKSKDDAPIFSPEDQCRLREELSNLGVVYGVLEDPIHLSDRIIVAKGTPPKPGKDAYLKLLVDMSRGPKEKGGRIDFRELNTIVCVKAGDRVIQKVPPSPGEPGCNVFGETIPSNPGKDIDFKYGKGLKVSPDGQYLVAEIDGMLIREEAKLQVIPEFVLNSDVDWNVGNIHFSGKKLVINGAVKRGFLVEVKGDLEIHGPVEDEVTIEVEGDLSISGLVQGEDTRIKCKGNASVSIVENASLFVEGDLSISDYLLNSRCRVGGNLKATEGTGKIIGGKALVGKSIVVGSLGSNAYVNTLVRAGYDETVWQRLEELRSKMILLRETAQKMKKILKTEKRLKALGQLDDHKKQLLQKIKVSYQNIQKELNDLEEEEKALLERFDNLKEAVIQVFKEVHPGVEIWIADRKFLVVRSLSRVIFYCKGKQVLFRVQSVK